MRTGLASVRWVLQTLVKTSAVPGGDVVSGGDGDAPPPGPVPATVRVSGEDALPASVAIATTVGQRQLLHLHRRADIQMSLRKGGCGIYGFNNCSVITDINPLPVTTVENVK